MAQQGQDRLTASRRVFLRFAALAPVVLAPAAGRPAASEPAPARRHAADTCPETEHIRTAYRLMRF